MKKVYVCGFMFSPDGKYIALILKKRGPSDMEDHYNGIGGEIKEGEQPLDAMIRECDEETGTKVMTWKNFSTIEFEGGIVHFFRSFTNQCYEVTTKTDEYVHFYQVDRIWNMALYPNLPWLIRLAQDKAKMTGTINP